MEPHFKSRQPLTRRVFLKYLMAQGVACLHEPTPLQSGERTPWPEGAAWSVEGRDLFIFRAGKKAEPITFLDSVHWQALIQPAPVSKRRSLFLLSAEFCQSILSTRLPLFEHLTFSPQMKPPNF